MLKCQRLLLYKLLVVESPTKVKKISGLLPASEWKVVATRGHLLKMKRFHPITLEQLREVEQDQQSTVEKLSSMAKSAEEIFLGTDPDREGEQIAFDCEELLRARGCKKKRIHRICFREITAAEILSATKASAPVCNDIVDAAAARRIVDMWFGYGSSRALNMAHPECKSAGRVQTPALHFVCARTEAREQHVGEVYYTVPVKATLSGLPWTANLTVDGVSRFKSAEETQAALEKSAQSAWEIKQVKTATESEPRPLFYDTAACVAAARTIGLSVTQATECLQRLYEEGLCTYIRTDSTRVSEEVYQSIHSMVSRTYGEDFVASKPRVSTKKSFNVQDAHEAIRPVDIEITPAVIDKQFRVSTATAVKKGSKKKSSSDDSADFMVAKVYRLLWNRTVAAAMKPPRYAKTTIVIGPEATDEKEVHVKFTRRDLVFAGGLSVEGVEPTAPPSVLEKEGDAVDVKADLHKDKTSAPALFTDSDLVKLMKTKGIGRPSTYEKVVKLLCERGYVKVGKAGALEATPSGKLAAGFMRQNLARWIDEKYTSQLESQLDAIASGTCTFGDFMNQFRKDYSSDIRPCYRQEHLGVHEPTGVNIWQKRGVNKSGRPWYRVEIGEGSGISTFAGTPSTSVEAAVAMLPNLTNEPKKKSAAKQLGMSPQGVPVSVRLGTTTSGRDWCLVRLGTGVEALSAFTEDGKEPADVAAAMGLFKQAPPSGRAVTRQKRKKVAATA